MKGAFSFRNENIRETQLSDGTILRIVKVGPAIARVYFVDDNSVEVPIPEGLVVHDVVNNVLIDPIPNTMFFILAWMDSYTISFNDELVVELTTQRQWSLRGLPETKIDTV
jgi:hypothetical protein